MKNKTIFFIIITNLILIGVVTLGLLATMGCGTTPPNDVCIEVDQELCPNANFENSTITLRKISYYDQYFDQNGGPYGDGMPQPELLTSIARNQEDWDENILASGTDKEAISWKNRQIEGYEINFGFWSKDSFRRYTFAEMFEWKFGRKPTEQEEQAITADQAWQWFFERHTVHRPWLLGGDDPPRDVRIINPPIKQFCFSLNSPNDSIGITYTGEYLLSGTIQFANGIKCNLVEQLISNHNLDANNSPHRVKMVIKKQCAACN